MAMAAAKPAAANNGLVDDEEVEARANEAAPRLPVETNAWRLMVRAAVDTNMVDGARGCLCADGSIGDV